MHTDFRPFTLDIKTRHNALLLKTAIGLMPASQQSAILYGMIQLGLGEFGDISDKDLPEGFCYINE